MTQSQPDESKADLARGAGGLYRYLQLERSSTEKRTYLKILRSKDESDLNKKMRFGFDGHSSDINEGRGGDYLYILWEYYYEG